VREVRTIDKQSERKRDLLAERHAEHWNERWQHHDANVFGRTPSEGPIDVPGKRVLHRTARERRKKALGESLEAAPLRVRHVAGIDGYVHEI
jgi:hypothetical protein